MASLKDCLGKIKLEGNARFWNEADHAALMKLAEKSDDTGAVAKFLEETQGQLDSISEKAKAASQKSSDRAVAALQADVDTITKDLNNEVKRMEEEASRIESTDPEGAMALRDDADFMRQQIDKVDKMDGYDEKAIAAAAECILNSPE